MSQIKPFMRKPVARKPMDGGFKQPIQPVMSQNSGILFNDAIEDRLEALEDKVQALEESKAIVEDNLAKATEMLETLLNDVELLQAEVRRYKVDEETDGTTQKLKEIERLIEDEKERFRQSLNSKIPSVRGWG